MKQITKGALVVGAAIVALTAGIPSFLPKPQEPQAQSMPLSEDEIVKCGAEARVIAEMIRDYGGTVYLGQGITTLPEMGDCIDGKLREATKYLPGGGYCLVPRDDRPAAGGELYFEILHTRQSLDGRICPTK